MVISFYVIVGSHICTLNVSSTVSPEKGGPEDRATGEPEKTG
jgi:hypothetical protein